jgi:WD40 repeat protein
MAKSRLVFNKHQGLVRAVSWSSNGKMLASGSDDKMALIWGADGTLQQKLLHADSVHTLAWSPDNQRLVTGTSNRVTFFRWQDGHALISLQPTPTGMISSLAWSPHGQMQVAASMTDTQAIVINTASYIIQAAFTGHTTSVEGVSWDANGHTVATCSMGGIVRVWNAVTGQEIHGYYQDGTAPTRAIAFAPTGGQLAVGSNDGLVHIWQGLACQQQGFSLFGQQCLDPPLRLPAAKQAIRALAWSPDARFLAVGSMDGLLSVWYPARQSGKPLFTVQQKAAVRSIAWSPDGRNLASAAGNTVTIWQLIGR